MKPVVLCLLLLVAPLLWTQQSSEVKSEWPICFNESEWAAFEADILAEMETTALDAANAAVIPHVKYEAELVKQIDTLKVQKQWWRIGTFTVGGLAVGLALWMALHQ